MKNRRTINDSEIRQKLQTYGLGVKNPCPIATEVIKLFILEPHPLLRVKAPWRIETPIFHCYFNDRTFLCFDSLCYCIKNDFENESRNDSFAGDFCKNHTESLPSTLRTVKRKERKNSDVSISDYTTSHTLAHLLS